MCGFGDKDKPSVVSRIYTFDNTTPAAFNSQSRLIIIHNSFYNKIIIIHTKCEIFFPLEYNTQDI